MTTYIHEGDIGTIFRLTIVDTSGNVIDVSSATTMYLYFQKPDGTNVQKTAEFYTDGTDGIIQYTSVDGDIDATGNWQVQGYIEVTDGKFYTRKTNFTTLSTLVTS